VSLDDYVRREEAAAASCDIREARAIAAAARTDGLDCEADLLLMAYGQMSAATVNHLPREAAR
jgi:hypothetical protein